MYQIFTIFPPPNTGAATRRWPQEVKLGCGRAKPGLSSRGSRVDVIETSKDWPGDDRSDGVERTRSGWMQIKTFGGGDRGCSKRRIP